MKKPVYREELIEKVHTWAAMMFPPDDIHFMLGMTDDEQKLMAMPGHLLFNAYRRGRLEAEATVRRKLLEMAAGGDERALARYQELITDSKLWK